MKNRNFRIIIALTSLAFVAWIAVVCLYADREQHAQCFRLSVGFTTLAFALSAVSLYFAGSMSDRGMTEINALPVLFSLTYFWVSFGLNTVFLALGLDNDMLHVILNLLALMVFATCRVFIPNYLKNAACKVEAVKLKTGNTTYISKQIGVLMQYAEDGEIQAALRTLKENVDYSSNTGSVSAAEVEEKIVLRLSELKDMLEQKREPQIVLNQISEVTMLWKERSVRLG